MSHLSNFAHNAAGLITSLLIVPLLMLVASCAVDGFGRGPQEMADTMVDQAIEACEENATCQVVSTDQAPDAVADAGH